MILVHSCSSHVLLRYPSYPPLLGFFLRLNHFTMSRQCGTPRRANSGRGRAKWGLHLLRVDAYPNEFSPWVLNLIDDWETMLVNDNLALGSPNHYWIRKNMMGSVVEEMIDTWNHTRSSVLQAKSKILELDTVITHRDVMTARKKLAMGLGSMGDGSATVFQWLHLVQLMLVRLLQYLLHLRFLFQFRPPSLSILSEFVSLMLLLEKLLPSQ